VWRDIINFKNKYEISNAGEIRNKNTGRILCPSKDGSGYLRIGLCKNGKMKSFSVHRLVLESFIGPCPPGMESCHNDGNIYNNDVNNLRFDTHQNNNRDKIKHNTIFRPKGSRHPRSKLNELQVRIIKYLLKDNKLTLMEISRIFFVSKRTIEHIKYGTAWKHVGI